MEIDITLPQQAYAVFESLNYTPWNAIGEFLDNSIQSYINYKQRLRKLENDYKLRIDINLGYNKLEISDNASGIDKDSLRKGLKPATKPEFSDGLSEFGMGMKTAAFWMCRKWKIISKHFDSKEEFTVEFDNVEIYSKDVRKIIAYPKNVENSTHYTKLILQDLVIDWSSEDIIEDLKENVASMYRHYIRNNEVDIYFNGEKLNFKVYGILRAKKAYGDNKERELDWKKKIDFTMESGKRVTGEAGLLEVGNPTRAGFTYMRRNRVIEGLVQGVKIIDILGTANTKRSQRVFAELNLDAFRVSHTKDRILFGKELYEFWSKLRRSLEEGEINLLKQAEEASYRTDKILKKSEENETRTTSDKIVQGPDKAPTRDKSSVVNNVLEINITDFDSPTVEVTGTLNKVASEMKQSYESMYKIENVLRLLIKNIETKNKISFLNENNYADVDEKNQIRNVNNFIKKVKKEESEKGYVSIRGKHDLYYTNFNALKVIIDLNYEKYFSTFFPVEKHVIDELDRLYTYRNNIAHHSYLSNEERSHIEISLQFFLKQLNGKIRLN